MGLSSVQGYAKDINEATMAQATADARSPSILENAFAKLIGGSRNDREQAAPDTQNA
jgi:hypothetical protein